jgi:Leucine Rich repeat
MKGNFKEPKMGHSIQYTPNNITLVIQPVHNIPVPQYTHVRQILPDLPPPSLNYVSPYSSFTPKENTFVPKEHNFNPQGHDINISNRQEVSSIGGSSGSSQTQQLVVQLLEAQVPRTEQQASAAQASQKALGGTGAPYYMGGILKYPGMSETLFEQQRIEFADLKSPDMIQEELVRAQKTKEINEVYAAQKAKEQQERDEYSKTQKLKADQEFEESRVGQATKQFQQAEEIYARAVEQLQNVQKSFFYDKNKALATQELERATKQLEVFKEIKKQVEIEERHDRWLASQREEWKKTLKIQQDKEKQDNIDAQQARINPSKKEVEEIELAPRKHNSPEVEEYSPLIIQTLKQYSRDYNGFHRQIVSDAIPLQALHTLSLKKTASVDSHVVDLVFDLLRDNYLPSLKTLDLSDNPKSIGAKQINKLTDSFLSRNNNLETLDISCLYPAPVGRAWSHGEQKGEHLGADIFANSNSQTTPDLGRSFNQLVLSVSTCAQPLCITIDSTIPPTHSAMLALVQEFVRNMGLSQSIFNTTGSAMIKHMAELCEIYQKNFYKAPMVGGENFMWGITKCLTPPSDIKRIDMMDYTVIKNGIVFVKGSESLQTLVQKIKIFICIAEVMEGGTISHDMLEYEGSLSESSIPVQLENVSSIEASQRQVIKSFASSCKDCEEIRVARETLENEPDSRSKMTKKFMGGGFRAAQLNLSHSDMDDGEVVTVANLVNCHLPDLRHLDVSNNYITYNGQWSLAYSMGKKIVTLNISNNQIGDTGAQIFANALTSGHLPNLKSLDVSGNQITPTGEGYFAKALQNETVQDIIIFLYKFDQYSKLLAGSKLEKIEAIQAKLAEAEAAGIDIQNMVVDKSFMSSVKDKWEIGKKALFSLGKCYVLYDDVQSYAADKIIAKVAPKLYSGVNAKDIVACGFHAIEEAYISEEGVHQLMKELEVISAGELFEFME